MDYEDYDTDEYYDEQGRKVEEPNYNMLDSEGPSVQHPPKKRSKKKAKKETLQSNDIRYTMDDMRPTVRDPRCDSKTELACFWPVYVGNFKDGDVAKYFASHGLHVRWWYRREDEYYRDFQCKAGLYDMLVYFVSERDANLAIERCHRQTHKGYTLNVFPGREPVYFKEDRSVYAEKMKSGRIFSEHFFEKHVRIICKVQVACVVKFDVKSGALEFENPSDVFKAQVKERMWNYKPVRGELQKQRYLEKDVLRQIETFLAISPDTLAVKQSDKNMHLLLNGARPVFNEKKPFKVVPLRRGPSKHAQKKLLERKIKKQMKRNGEF